MVQNISKFTIYKIDPELNRPHREIYSTILNRDVRFFLNEDIPCPEIVNKNDFVISYLGSFFCDAETFTNRNGVFFDVNKLFEGLSFFFYKITFLVICENK